MNKKVKKEWVEALESGKYRQGEMYLKKPGNKFCCLGVLTDLYCKKHNVNRETKEKLFNHTQEVLHFDVMKWAGLKQKNPKVKIREVKNILNQVNDEDSLAVLNDRGFKFKEIARVIRKLL